LLEEAVAQTLTEGYAFVPLSNNLECLLQSLRRYVGKVTCTELAVRSPHDAKPNTMSRLFGKGEFPHHTDFAFRPLPPRLIFLVNDTDLAFDRVTYVTPLRLLPSNDINKIISSAWELRTPAGVFTVSGGFNIAGTHVLRWDTVFLQPSNETAIHCAEIIPEILRNHQIEHCWDQHSALLIDNWSCTHARGPAGSGVIDMDRRLKRYEVWHHARMG
jgi:hypothetical protein